ncbi:MAG TPA: hypothetical protein VJH88_03605 [Candidatus Nanoarchaeia archaeon]|nr:hypothetical protein [Candidatus Nanoarchaeia archaeon]
MIANLNYICSSIHEICYYHAALALILTREYSSKNHLATLCVLIKEFYRKELSKEDIEVLGEFVDCSN